jgi:hypothetical protein
MTPQAGLAATDARRRILAAGWITAAGLAVLAALSWTGMVYRPFRFSGHLLLACVAVPAAFYLRAIPAAVHVPARTILKFAILFGVISFFILPFQSTDVFFYMAKGWQQAGYASNPYAAGLRELDHHGADPMIFTEWNALNKNPWLDLPLPYGFLFAALTRILARAGGGNWWLTLALFNAANCAAHAGTAWLVWRLSHRLKLGEPKRALFLYAWSPFVLAQFLGELHNDIFVGVFVILAVHSLAVKRPEWTLASLAAAGLIKYTALALMPLAGIAILRWFGWRKLTVSAIYAGAGAALISAPYLIDAPAFKLSQIAVQWTESSRSFHSFVFGVLKLLGISADRFPTLVPSLSFALQAALWMAFAAFIAAEIWKSRKRRMSLDRIVCQWSAAMAFLLFLASSQLYPWYIGMVLPLAVLGYQTWISRAVVLASAAHLLGFTGLKRVGYFLICTLLPFAAAFFGAVRLKLLRTAPHPPAAPLRRSTANG